MTLSVERAPGGGDPRGLAGGGEIAAQGPRGTAPLKGRAPQSDTDVVGQRAPTSLPDLLDVVASGAASKRAVALSPRELHVVAELARGSSIDGIAATLGLSSHTVRTHVRNVMRKLGAQNRAHAVAICLKEAAQLKGATQKS